MKQVLLAIVVLMIVIFYYSDISFSIKDTRITKQPKGFAVSIKEE